jgi:hypothetical protein
MAPDLLPELPILPDGPIARACRAWAGRAGGVMDHETNAGV